MGAQARSRTVLSTKGQVILPKAIRELMDWKPGTRLTVEKTDEGVLLKTAALFPETSLDSVCGMLKYDGPALTIEEMDAAILREARRRARG